MGYVRNRTFPLDFTADPQFEGLEVEAGHGTLHEYFTVQNLIERPVDDSAAALKDMDQVFDIVVPLLESWNLEESDGTPIPLNRESFAAQDRVFTGYVIAAWRRGVSSVSRPLDQPSASGEQSVVASIPTEALSSAPQS